MVVSNLDIELFLEIRDRVFGDVFRPAPRVIPKAATPAKVSLVRYLIAFSRVRF
jgi:hypothetical protein